MSTLAWIVSGGIAMSAIALVGTVTLLLSETTQQRLVRPLVAFAAGSLLGGALLHTIPEAARRDPGGVAAYLWVLSGFALFRAIEQFLHWHHCHRASADCRQPLTYDLVPEVNRHHDPRVGATHFLAFVARGPGCSPP